MLLTLSIVIPAYNEAARLGGTLAAVFDYLNERNYESEVIVVDDGSKDETSAVAQQSFARAGRISARVIRHEENRGKGYVVRTGLLAARAPIALFSDADLSTPISETPKLVAPIQSGDYDVVFGSRALDRSLIGKHQPWRREQGGRVFNLMVRMLTGLPFWDTQCGFKAFRMTVCRPLVEAGAVDRFGFDVELLWLAHLAGLRLRERAVRWDDDDRSTLNFRSGLHAFGEVRALRKLVKSGRYDDAIREARELSERESRARSPFASDESREVESDASPELASVARRI